MTGPQQLLPCIDTGEHHFTAITYEFQTRSGIQVYCQRCGRDRERLIPGWEELEREGLKKFLDSIPLHNPAQ